jgi:hypothetical protein
MSSFGECFRHRAGSFVKEDSCVKALLLPERVAHGELPHAQLRCRTRGLPLPMTDALGYNEFSVVLCMLLATNYI